MAIEDSVPEVEISDELDNKKAQQKLIGGKASIDEMTSAEKWLIEMQLSEDPLRICKRKLQHFEIPLGVEG